MRSPRNSDEKGALRVSRAQRGEDSEDNLEERDEVVETVSRREAAIGGVGAMRSTGRSEMAKARRHETDACGGVQDAPSRKVARATRVPPSLPGLSLPADAKSIKKLLAA